LTHSLFSNDSGRDKSGYYHEFFLQGRPSLAENIRRIKIKGKGARKPNSPETEPNFYCTPLLSASEDGNANVQANVSPTLASFANNALVLSSSSGINNRDLNHHHFAAAATAAEGFSPWQSSLRNSLFVSPHCLPQDASLSPSSALILALQRAQTQNNRPLFANATPFEARAGDRNNLSTQSPDFTLPSWAAMTMANEILRMTGYNNDNGRFLSLSEHQDG
jgi:hypothetical protein